MSVLTDLLLVAFCLLIAGLIILSRVQVPHQYVSTGCYHELHEQCPKTCKWCHAKCRCKCHRVLA